MQIEQLEAQLNDLESQSSLFFDKIANALTAAYPLDEAKKNRDTMLQTIDVLESLLSQTNLIYLCAQNPGTFSPLSLSFFLCPLRSLSLVISSFKLSI